MTLEMCEAHLDLPAFTGRLFEGLIQHKGTAFFGNLDRRRRKGQFGLRHLGPQDQTAPAVWNAVLRG
jgi:hypothetical protein